MGLMLSLDCPACGYRAEQLLTGWGMAARMEIMRCENCRELVHVVVEVDPLAPEPWQLDLEAKRQQCPLCRGNTLALVPEPYHCPKCGTALVVGADGGLWD
jgi:hypothetical protein